MNFSELMQQGGAHAWLYIPVAIALGALHGLEPGHSKTMMAAFIIAIRGTIRQAVLLGISAAISHSLIIWALAALALKFGSKWGAQATEPYFQLFSAVAVLLMAGWMFWRIRRDARSEAEHHHHHHHHEPENRVIKTKFGEIQLQIFEDGVPPVFRLRFSSRGRTVHPHPSTIRLMTNRDDGSAQEFPLVLKDDYLESVDEIPEPHQFNVSLVVTQGDHSQTFDVAFEEHEHHDHGHHNHDGHLTEEEFQDAHEAEHAAEIERRFANRQVTTGQIILFGLTGGLMPCPAAFTVLIVCLQVKKYSLGFALVAAFSLGLALIMVTVGAAAAMSVRHAEKRFKGFNTIMRRAPLVSCALLVIIACYMAWHGWRGLQGL